MLGRFKLQNKLFHFNTVTTLTSMFIVKIHPDLI